MLSGIFAKGRDEGGREGGEEYWHSLIDGKRLLVKKG